MMTTSDAYILVMIATAAFLVGLVIVLVKPARLSHTSPWLRAQGEHLPWVLPCVFAALASAAVMLFATENMWLMFATAFVMFPINWFGSLWLKLRIKRVPFIDWSNRD